MPESLRKRVCVQFWAPILIRRTQEGRGSLQGENPVAFPNSGPMFPESILLPRKFSKPGRNHSAAKGGRQKGIGKKSDQKRQKSGKMVTKK